VNRLLFAAVTAALYGVCFAGGAAKITDGWENLGIGRDEPFVAGSNLVWKAALSAADAFTLVKRNGAEGEIAFKDGELTVRKTNDKGFLLVKAAPFAAPKDVVLRFTVDVHVDSAIPERSHGYLRASAGNDTIAYDPEGRKADSDGGWNVMMGLTEQPAGVYYRKYYHFKNQQGTVHPTVVIAGDESVSTWKNWTAEDLVESKKAWAEEVRKTHARRPKPEDAVISEEELNRFVSADPVDHTAKTVTENGQVYLMIDGKKTLPVAYHGVYHHSDFSEATTGQLITRGGVPITIPWIQDANANWTGDVIWTSHGYDAKKAVKKFRESMRGDTNALYMVCFGCNTYPDFIRKEHPDEAWIGADGKPVFGCAATCTSGYDGMVKNNSWWPWPSMASPAWRGAVKDNLRAFVREMKSQGLAKKLIGIHFLGYNDGQFGMAFPDYSSCAKTEYAKYVVENPGTSTNYWHFCRQLGTIAQEDFAHAFKEAMGKDVIAIRWDDAPFVVDFSHGKMCRDPKGIDIAVSQPTYIDRWPGLLDAPYVPFSSMALHGKMHWYEFDLRTYWMQAGGSLAGATRVGYSPDIGHWRSTYRKLAGEMIAQRSGFWFYDMGRGWFAAPEIAADINGSLEIFAALNEKTPSPWRSDVALVVDEEGFFGWEGGPRFDFPDHTYHFVEKQLRYLAGSGVPYEYYLAEDVIANPALLDGAKTVVSLLWRKFDEPRLRAVKHLSSSGRTLVFLTETGVLGGAKEATGFNVGYFDKDARTFEVKTEDGFPDPIIGSYELEYQRSGRILDDPEKPIRIPCGRRCWVEEESGVKVWGRFTDSGKAAIAERADGGCRRIYLAVPGGLTPEMFNRFARESGAYVPVGKPWLQVNMNGDFVSVHALRGGQWDFKLPFPAKVTNLKSGRKEWISGDLLKLNMTAGETCWFSLDVK